MKYFIGLLGVVFILLTVHWNASQVQSTGETSSNTRSQTPLSASPTKEASPIERLLYDAKAPLHEATYHAVRAVQSAAEQYAIDYNHIVTLIDYSLPANQKRLWVFDFNTNTRLFHTYVSHGINSGELISDRFSNRYNSKASSIGVYRTQKTYYGREGLTLKLQGLEAGFNDNAENRAIVMHGGWYMDEAFIRKYGRSGRSWGCPALPRELRDAIIHTIQDNGLLIVYYPDKRWFMQSKFLQADPFFIAKAAQTDEVKQPADSARDTVLFASPNHPKRAGGENAVLAMPADVYQQQFQQIPPLTRMLRRRVNGMEYIALSVSELDQLSQDASSTFGVHALALVMPVIKMVRGYYETKMQILPLGTVDKILHTSAYSLQYQSKTLVTLRTSTQFIRWLGL